jgi:hypothetical protein
MWRSRWVGFLRSAWHKLPVETAVVAMAAAGAIALVHNAWAAWGIRFLAAGVLLAPLALAAHRLGRRRQAIAIAAGAALALWALTAALPDAEAIERLWFRWPYLLALIAAMAVPGIAAGRQFSRFVRRFFEETTAWGLMLACAQIGLGVIAMALAELFELRTERLYADAAIALTSGFVLLYLDRLLAGESTAPGKMPELWRRLATAVGAPFVSAMLAILLAYEAVTLVRGELPRNLLSPLIMAAGFVGFATTLIIASVVRDEPSPAALSQADPFPWLRRPSIRLARAFPAVLLALLPMAIWALWVRIDQYGVTPPRAIRAAGLLCLSALCIAGAIRWWRGRAPLTWQVPAVIAACAVITRFGPLSAIRLSIASQSARLAHQLDAVGAGRSVGPAPSSDIILDQARYHEIADRIAALARIGGEPALRHALSGAVDACNTTWVSTECMQRLGLYPRDSEPLEPAAPTSYALDARAAFSPGPGQLVFVELTGDGELELPVDRGGGPALALRLAGDAISLERRSDPPAAIATASLAQFTAALAGTALPAQLIALTSPDGATLAELAIQHLDLAPRPGAAPAIQRLTGAVIVRPQ